MQVEKRKTKVSAANLESEILRKIGADKQKTIVIRGDKEVPYKNVMKVIDIANRNKLKMILAVKGK
jgi:biopolymer transport protein ExbD